MRQRAQNVVEYGLLMATIAIIVLIGSTMFGDVLRVWLEALLRRLTTS